MIAIGDKVRLIKPPTNSAYDVVFLRPLEYGKLYTVLDTSSTLMGDFVKIGDNWYNAYFFTTKKLPWWEVLIQILCDYLN